jgi:hypothetical protein
MQIATILTAGNGGYGKQLAESKKEKVNSLSPSQKPEG